MVSCETYQMHSITNFFMHSKILYHTSYFERNIIFDRKVEKIIDKGKIVKKKIINLQSNMNSWVEFEKCIKHFTIFNQMMVIVKIII